MKNLKFSFWSLIVLYFFGLLPFSIIVAILSLMKITPVYLNNAPYTGVQGFVLGILGTVLFALILAIWSFILLNLGLLILRIFNFKSKKRI